MIYKKLAANSSISVSNIFNLSIIILSLFYLSICFIPPFVHDHVYFPLHIIYLSIRIHWSIKLCIQSFKL